MKALKTKDVALIGLFAALTVICAWISIPLGPVPVTLQTFAVFLAAALLGPKRGTLAVAVYIFLGVVGMAMGLLVCYLIGTVWFYYVMHFRGTEYGFGKILSLCVVPFILPDLVKLSLAWFLSLKLKKHVK